MFGFLIRNVCYKNETCGTVRNGDDRFIPGLGRSPEGGRGNPVLQYSCLENAMNRGASWATVHGAAKSQTQLDD